MPQQLHIATIPTKEDNPFRTPNLKKAADKLIEKLGNGNATVVSGRFLGGENIFNRNSKIDLVYDVKDGRFVVQKFVPYAYTHLLVNEVEILKHLQRRSLRGKIPELIGFDYDVIHMSVIDGIPLSEITKCDPKTLLAVMTGSSEVLREIHRAGVVNRDIKPGNLLLSDERVHIIDYGLAKTTGIDKLHRCIFGTPHYMSPEQTINSEVGPPSDIYSLGVVFYELLSDRLPFECPTTNDYLMKHRLVPPPKPKPLHDESKSLVNLIMKCLCKKPQDRFNFEDLHDAVLEEAKKIERLM